MPKKFVFGNQAVVAHDRKGKAVNVAPAMNLAGGTVNIMVFGEISAWWGVNKNEVYWALKGQNVSRINVFISSPGGEIDEAFVIHDMLRGHPANVTAYLVGQCASAATIISCAADEVIMSNQCIYMIHKPSWFCWGDADAMGKAEEILNKYQTLIVNVYKRKTGMSDAALNDLINEETWFEPTEALALGFVDSVVDNIQVDFLLPTTGTAQPDTGQDTTFDNVSTYRVAALAALERGMRPANRADIKTFVPQKKHNAMFGKDFFSNILNALKSEKALAKNADVEALAETLADDETLIEDLETAAIEDAVKKEVAKNKPEAFTIESLCNLVAAAKPEEKIKLAAALNVKAETKKPAAKAEGEEESDDTDEDEQGEEDAAITALRTQLEGALNEIAKIKKGGTVVAPTNGGSSVKDKNGKLQEGKVSAVQLQIAQKALAQNHITREQYTTITGEQPPAKPQR